MSKVVAFSIGAIGAVLSAAVLAQTETWSPHLEFQLETLTYKESLIWLSGVSYAWSATFEGIPKDLPVGKCRFIEINFSSREFVEVLNRVHKGQTISAERAIGTLKREVTPAHLVCPE